MLDHRDVRTEAVRPGALSTLLEELFVDDAARGSGWSTALRPGAIIGRFELVRELGRGGFGVVYEARDRELGRAVAFKAVRAGSGAAVCGERLLREAETAARLSHPNIVTLHDVGRCEFGPYLVFELLEGQTLSRRLELGRVPTLEALRIGVDVASGLAHAHAHGVVHRDLSPGNVFLCDDGRVKVLDLGLAHAFGQRNLAGGTPGYMAPEQLAGAPEDERTDVYALGVVLYRMLANALPFPQRTGDAAHRTSRARALEIQEEPGLGELVSRMLDPDPVRRPRDAGEVLASLRSFDRELRRASPTGTEPRVALAQRRWRAPVAIAAALAACVLLAWLLHHESRVRWARDQALPQIGALVEQGKYAPAFALAVEVEKLVPDDPRLHKVWPTLSRLLSIDTTPEGADVYVKDYAAPEAAWRRLGQTPLVRLRLPWTALRLRIEKRGFARVDAVPRLPLWEFGREHVHAASVQFTLDPVGAIPPGMRTARPGPATWESGDYPPGQGDLPVTGVSWYEAAAYAAFAGRALPTVYQWTHAAGIWGTAQIVPASNFGDAALAPVASGAGVGPFGTYDMAGNAKEWCWNAHGTDRYILGGAWNEPSYMFNSPDSRSPFARDANFGFRLAEAVDHDSSPAASAPIPWRVRDLAGERPVGPDVFAVFKRLYAYDRTPLAATVDAVDDTSERWRKEKVSFAAAYGGERVVAYVFTPRWGHPPFHTVMFFPGVSAIYQHSSDDLTLMRLVGPVVSSGRAVVYPVYKSTYERGDDVKSGYTFGTVSYRDHVIAWSKDLDRSIDYAQTRPDLDAQRIALYGVSWGAKLAPILAAVEDRIKLAILVGGGLAQQESLPEADPLNFAPYVRQPVLMVNGRYDFLFPLKPSQQALFRLLGSRAEDKRHVVFDSGHLPPNEMLTREVLDWLDRYLGPAR